VVPVLGIVVVDVLLVAIAAVPIAVFIAPAFVVVPMFVGDDDGLVPVVMMVLAANEVKGAKTGDGKQRETETAHGNLQISQIRYL
jgi:hypothetical protein